MSAIVVCECGENTTVPVGEECQECNETAHESMFIIDSAHGIYIPKIFAHEFDTAAFGISAEDRAILLNPKHDHYDETWSDVSMSAETADGWTLEQDCDLFMVRYKLPEVSEGEVD